MSLRPATRLIALLLIALLFSGHTLHAAPSATSDSSSVLAELLENEGARNALIEQLRNPSKAVNNNDTPAKEQASPENDTSPHDGEASDSNDSLARQLATLTAAAGENFKQQLATLAASVKALTDSNDKHRVDMAAIISAASHLALLAFATFALFFILHRAAKPLFAGIDDWAVRGSHKFAMLRTVAAVSTAGLVDLATVLLACASGHVIASQLSAEAGADSTRLALFLNAFLIVEGIKLVLRALFASRFPALRLLPLNQRQAKYCNRFFANITGFTGYGMMVLVPIVNANASEALGSALSTSIVLLAALYYTATVLLNRKRLRDQLFGRAANYQGSRRIALRLLARSWHLLALAYALVVVFTSLLRPESALPFVALATLQTATYAGLGSLLLVVLRQLIGREVRLSESINEQLPHLQKRLNTYIPTGLRILRVLVTAAIVVWSLDAWSVLDLGQWYATDVGRSTVSSLVDILLILALAAGLWIALASFIEHRLSPTGMANAARAARAETLLGLFHTSLAAVIIVMTTMIVLSEIGVDIGPLIAGAGVLGLAVGFGAQKLVQDVINGIFIQLENAMNTGDYVLAGGHEGTVERVGIRSVALRDLFGTYHIVPFSSVDSVSNYTRDFAYHLGEYGIAYRENIDKAIEHLQAAFEELASGEHKQDILEPMQVAGVSALADSSVNIRVLIKTAPGMQWAVGRAYNRLVKMHFDEAGIEIPFPHTTLYFGEDKNGDAPAANVRLASNDGDVVASQDSAR
jgi:small conductance mechanosensitive channel